MERVRGRVCGFGGGGLLAVCMGREGEEGRGTYGVEFAKGAVFTFWRGRWGNEMT